MSRFFNRNHTADAPPETTTAPNEGDLEPQVQDLIAAAHDLLRQATALRERERSLRRDWNAAHVQPWLLAFDQARTEMLDYASQHRRDLEAAHELVLDNKPHLVDLFAIRGLRDRHATCETLLRQAPEPPMGIESFLQRLRRGTHRLGETDNLVDQVLGPPPSRAYTVASEAASRWRDDLRELPPEIYVPVAGGRSLIFDHDVIRQRLETEKVQEAATV